MILYVLFALAFAKIKGNKLVPLLKAYSLYPFVVAELIYMLLQINIFLHNYNFIQYTSIINRAYMYTLLLPIFVYKLYKPGILGSLLMITGTFLNKLVMSHNGGKMPVFPSLSKVTGYYNEAAILTVDNIHISGDESTKFKILTDFIDVGYSILSIGDILIHSFIFIVIYYTVIEINKNLNNTNENLQEG